MISQRTQASTTGMAHHEIGWIPERRRKAKDHGECDRQRRRGEPESDRVEGNHEAGELGDHFEHRVSNVSQVTPTPTGMMNQSPGQKEPVRITARTKNKVTTAE